MKLHCPHCGRRGISLFDKLLLSATLWFPRYATCSRCAGSVGLTPTANRVQFALYVLLLVAFGWSLRDPGRLLMAYLAAGLILLVGLLAPLHARLG